ncbi:MAG: flagellar hook-associated protein FlgK [Gemmatimonadetes bacterium]|nr:flagellar hook-associated protein FlgK [Gemmatimonadota bacterium]
MDSLFGVGRSAILAQQAAIQVAGHNIANAETPGYTRESVQLTAAPPEYSGLHTFGTGVAISNVVSARDALLSAEVRSQNTPASSFKTRAGLLGQVETVLGDPNTNALSGAIDGFYNAWSDLSSNPADAASKTVVQQRAQTLVDSFHTYASQLTEVGTQASNSLADSIRTVNSLTTKIAQINKLIVPAEATGQPANDLRDQRDQLIDQLSTIVPITVMDRADGGNQIVIGSVSIVDGGDAKTLTLNNTTVSVTSPTGTGMPLRSLGGQMGAYIDFLSTDLPGVQGQLNAIASAIITDVNTVHKTGWSTAEGAGGVAGNWDVNAPPTGSNVDFFDSTPGNASAINISLSASVAASASAIASGNTRNAAGNNTVALNVAALRDNSPSAAGNSVTGAFRTLVSGLAVKKNSADDSATVYKTLADQASNRRQSATGVNTDEELMKLIRYQQAFIAASKYMQTVNEMSQSLMSIKQ